MPEPRLTAVSALGGAAPSSRRWRDLSIDEILDRPLVSVAARHGQGEALRAAAATAFGVALPDPGHWARANGLSFFWTGPDQWLTEGSGDGPSLAHALGLALGGTASIVEQSDAWVRFELAGPQTRAVLEKLCPLDLHPSAFPVGAAARTLMDHLGVSIALMDEGPRFALWVERSAARSFLHALVQAADSTCGPD